MNAAVALLLTDARHVVFDYERFRHVPEQMWYTHPAFAIALGGILPFGAVCIELFFIMSALWLHQVCLPRAPRMSLVRPIKKSR